MIYIFSRSDRYGANAVPWLNAIALSHVSQEPLVHICSSYCDRYRENVAHQLLLKYAQVTTDQEVHSADHRTTEWIFPEIQRLMAINGQIPLPDYLRKSGLAKSFYQAFQQQAKKKKWGLGFQPATSLIIHVRLGDVKDKQREYKQTYIGNQGLVQLLRKSHQRYPTHQLYLMMDPDPNDRQVCKQVIKESGLKVTILGSSRIDKDLWKMMSADILIMSRSSFSLLAGLCHQGSRVFTYTRWLHYDDLLGIRLPDKKKITSQTWGIFS